MVTERQQTVLEGIVNEYIKRAQPVGSELLEQEYDFGIKPATIRLEMQRLTEDGYIYQPHTSAGRIPTDKGYRFFVDKLLDGEVDRKNRLQMDGLSKLVDEIDEIHLMRGLTKILADLSPDMAVGYELNMKMLWKEGWEEVLKEPEFKNSDYVFEFTELVKYLENDLERLHIKNGVQIYIGEENPFHGANNFSAIIAKCRLPNDTEGLLGIIGPKRMPYERNMVILEYATKFLEGSV